MDTSYLYKIRANSDYREATILFIIDVVDVNDFQPDSAEVNPHTKLGEAGRRALERQGQRSFGYPTGPLFDAPEASNGMNGPLRLSETSSSLAWNERRHTQ